MTPPKPPADALAGESIVARADALMKRRRAQEAQEADDWPVLTEAVVPAEDDFPVLTAIAPSAPETVPATPLPAKSSPAARAPGTTPAPAIAKPASAAMDGDTLDKLAQELTRSITARLNAELPHLVHIALQETLTHVEQELRAGIAEATDAALRDFLKDQSRRGKNSG